MKHSPNLFPLIFCLAALFAILMAVARVTGSAVALWAAIGVAAITIGAPLVVREFGRLMEQLQSQFYALARQDLLDEYGDRVLESPEAPPSNGLPSTPGGKVSAGPSIRVAFGADRFGDLDREVLLSEKHTRKNYEKYLQ